MAARPIIRLYVNVARPGTIVSTILDEDTRVETVTFTTDHNYTPGFTTKVERSDDARDALAMHTLAVAGAR